MCEIVAGVDHQVRLQRAQGGQPALPGLANGVMWTSDMWSTRMGRAPGGSTGTATRRSRKAFTSYSPAYAKQPARPPDAEQALDDRLGRTVHRHNQKATSESCCHTGRMSNAPSTLKERLRSDLTEAIKDRDKVRSGTIRMVLTAITEAEVAGSQAIELSDQQVLDVVIREAKKRREAEEAYAMRVAGAGREERAEPTLADYLPQQLTQDEIAAIVADAIASTGAAELGMKGMGKVMAQVTPQGAGKADGSVVAVEVRRHCPG